MGFLGIEFAPLNVPLKRRLETTAALVWISCPTIFPIVSWILFGYVLVWTRFCYLALLYLVFQYWDVDTPQSGGRPIEWCRNAKIWKHLDDYFPLSVVKTVELPPDRNYLFGFFPHGVLSSNVAAHFATHGTGLNKAFPGLTKFCATLDVHFRTPVFRDFILGMGFVSSSKNSLLHLLRSKVKGTAVALIVGGAQEALYAKPGSYRIVLKRRKGFIKIALRTGATLVPVYGFGENDLFEQVANPPGSLLFKFQEFFKKRTGLAPVIPIGRGLFQYSYGIIPRRQPITTVFGEPIDMPLDPDPSNELIEKYHALFTEKLIALFEEHKHKYVENPETAHLIIE